MKRRNPNWTEEELILAYDVLQRIGADALHNDHPEIIALNRLLNELTIHDKQNLEKPFRNPVGVRRRLSYLNAIDVGADVAGRETYKRVIEKYQSNLNSLRADAKAIRNRK